MPVSATDVQIPSGLPVLPGLLLSATYVVSATEPLNKGDALDATPLPGHRVALMVADVVGSGIGAAVAVSQIKAVLRERLCAGESLAAAVEAADRYAAVHAGLRGTTSCVAVIGVDDGDLEWATAGHPAPVRVIPGGRAELLPVTTSRPLGAGGSRATQRARLEPGDLLALYTDGLVHSAELPPARGLEGLRVALADACRSQPAVLDPATADRACDLVVRRVLPESSSDDAALLVAVRSPVPTDFELRTAAVPENLPQIRHRINEWLDGLGAGLTDHVGLGHAVVELAANVVAHAYVSVPAAPVVRIQARLGGDGIVSIVVSDRGRWREHSGSGRGLMMAAGLADGIEVARSPDGTEVTLTQRLTRPVPLLQRVPSDEASALEEPRELEADAELGRLVVRGPVDDLTIDHFEGALSRATRGGTADAEVDLGGVTHLASPGVRLLFDFRARSERTGTELVLRAPRDSSAGHILQLVGLPFSS